MYLLSVSLSFLSLEGRNFAFFKQQEGRRMKPVPQKRVIFNGMQDYFQQLRFSSTNHVFFRTVQWSAKKHPTAKFSATSQEVNSLYKWLKNFSFCFKIYVINPFLFIKNKSLILSSSPPLKKTLWYVFSGHWAIAAHPVGYDSPLQIVVVVWRTFL